MKSIKFTLNGQYAHFKRLEGSMVKQTHTIPTRTALYGLIGAIMGAERDTYYESYHSTLSVAIIPKNIRRQRIPQLQVSTGSTPRLGKTGLRIPEHNKNRQRVAIEYLANPEYTVYLTGPDEFIDEFKSRLIHNRYEYTPYLGTTECLCNIEFEDTVELSQSNSIKVDSVVSEDKVDSVKGTKDAKVTFERITTNFEQTSSGRKPTGFDTIIVALNNEKLEVNTSEQSVLTDGNNNILYI